jgi:hypothetical protein
MVTRAIGKKFPFRKARPDPIKFSDTHPYYLRDSTADGRKGFSTLDTAREALLAWIFQQRRAGETVVERETGEWSDSRTAVWISDRDDKIVRLKE